MRDERCVMKDSFSSSVSFITQERLRACGGRGVPGSHAHITETRPALAGMWRLRADGMDFSWRIRRDKSSGGRGGTITVTITVTVTITITTTISIAIAFAITVA